MITRDELIHFYNEVLQPKEFADYGPNGLQIEGSEQIEKIAFAVSATRDSISKAIARGADTLVVHHGLFWQFHGSRPIIGPFAKRIKPLIINNINLVAYHLPLDGHIEIGNAACLAQLLQCSEPSPFGDYKGSATGVQGRFYQPVKAFELKQMLESILQHTVIMASPDCNAFIESVGIITGGANHEWLSAVNAGLDAYITGEISEHDWHDSQEHGIHMFAGGHHATEQFGVQALMKKTEEKFALTCC